MPDGVPQYVRVYDNGGKTDDRYTVVYTGNYKGRNGRCDVRSMSIDYMKPNGVNIFDSYREIIDRPKSDHLGHRITFEELPRPCKEMVIADYKELWRLNTVD